MERVVADNTRSQEQAVANQPHASARAVASELELASQAGFLFLSKPRLVFNPPVLKDNLQKGKGWLSKRTFSFDELFEAWGC